MTEAQRPTIIQHRVRRMTGRDPDEQHRVATPLELLFDLTFVIAFGIAANEFAHLLAENHIGAGLLGFSLATLSVCWAWINFTWFASAYDTDDWIYRITTMVQMMGVVVLALGLPRMFDSVDSGENMDNRAMVVGYVIMRVPMLSQWLRAARQDPSRRESAYIYVVTIGVAQLLWVAYLFVELDPYVWFAGAIPLILFEMLGPWIAEHRGDGTPWHPHHVAERYGLLTIITFGEVVIGSVASLSAVLDVAGWTLDIALLLVGGIGLTFGMWWIYFFLPAGEVLHRRRRLGFLWGYGHLFVFAAIAALGAGLHVAALYIEDEAHISATAVMLTMAIPVALYFVTVMVLVASLIGLHPGAAVTTALKLGCTALAVALAAGGVRLAVCVLVLALAPAISVIANETGSGTRRRELIDAELARLDRTEERVG